jgi:transposase
VRYILRKNKYRAIELKQNREDRIKRLMDFVTKKNKYLKEHPKAQIIVAQRDINKELVKLKLKNIVTVDVNERGFSISIDEEAKEKQGELDGCYVVKTGVPKEELNTKEAHDRYKDLGLVEFAFRTMKTTIEELRPIFVRKEDRTKGHVFVVMLAYMITKYISDKIASLNYTRKFAIESLDKIQYIEYDFKGTKIKVRPHNLSNHQKEILDALDIKLNVAKKESA